jgi:hypothetical protein
MPRPVCDVSQPRAEQDLRHYFFLFLQRLARWHKYNRAQMSCQAKCLIVTCFASRIRWGQSQPGVVADSPDMLAHGHGCHVAMHGFKQRLLLHMGKREPHPCCSQLFRTTKVVDASGIISRNWCCAARVAVQQPTISRSFQTLCTSHNSLFCHTI